MFLRCYITVEDSQSFDANGLLIEGIGQEHALIYHTIPVVQNTGYFIANKLFYPGDALTNPEKAVEILALPVAGPWLKLVEAIDYALEVKPKICFPVHDGNLVRPGITYATPLKILNPQGIKFIPLDIDKEQEIISHH